VIKVYLNGRLQTMSEARVPAMDAGLLLGAGLFETLRAYGSTNALSAGERFVFRLGDHLDRLFASAKALDIPIEESREELERAVAETIAENGLEDARCRITVTRGPLPSEHLAGPIRPTCLVTAGEMTPYAPELYETGTTVTVSDVRINETDPAAGHKTTNYLTNLLVLREAHGRGTQEALRFNGPGRLVEGCLSNVFLVKGGRLLTPPLAEGCLPGVTRGVVLALAAAEGIAAAEETIPAQDVLTCEEMFLTNTIMEVMPVGRIERHAIGEDKPGPVTRRLMELYKQQIEKERK
jgi:branched-chain amino acid aminotransferase